ncbi:MAG TPA: NAD(P)/FAD-dependent oxidoreductase [Haloplasmataceae bacterium]
MINRDLVIIGGGPSGLCAAKMAAMAGQSSLVIDRNPVLGGQLIKQTHMFFGSEKQYAKTRGIDIAKKLVDDVREYSDLIEVWENSTVVGLYHDKVVTVLKENEKYVKVQAKAIIVATGASEKVLAFENNDLPGIYGAGAVQTLMNVYGVKPGNNIVMVGSGNIGLIVSYQLMQAGVNVLAVIEASPKIGGYKVHAAKLRRLGVDIITSCTIKKAIGKEAVEKIVTVRLDEKWNEISGTEKEYDIDAVCIAVGLTPLTSLLSMINCEMKYVSELGGLVAITDSNHETSIENVFVCGDASGIEEASSAIVEGYLTGLIASKKLGKVHPQYEELKADFTKQLDNLRNGPFGEKIRLGLKKLGGIREC